MWLRAKRYDPDRSARDVAKITNAVPKLDEALSLRLTGKATLALRQRAPMEAEPKPARSGSIGPAASVDSARLAWRGIAIDPAGLALLVSRVSTELHSAVEQYGDQLECAAIEFRRAQPEAVADDHAEQATHSAQVALLVYSATTRRWHPVAQVAGERRRDTELELAIRDCLGFRLRLQRDVSKWYSLWDPPGLAVRARN